MSYEIELTGFRYPHPEVVKYETWEEVCAHDGRFTPEAGECITIYEVVDGEREEFTRRVG